MIVQHRSIASTRRKQGYYLALRQYEPGANRDAAALDAKRIRLAGYREQFKEVESGFGGRLRFGIPSGRGKNEADVAVLFFDAEGNSVPAVLEHFPAIHRGLALRVPPPRPPIGS